VQLFAGGQDEFFGLLGVPVPTRTSPPPKPTPEQQEEMKQKVQELSPRFRTELLEHA
jgi:hypothetical protein